MLPQWHIKDPGHFAKSAGGRLNAHTLDPTKPEWADYAAVHAYTYCGNLSGNEFVSRCGLAVRRLAGKQKDLGSIRFGSPFSSLQNLWFMDTVL